jgi:hypothetical protein
MARPRQLEPNKRISTLTVAEFEVLIARTVQRVLKEREAAEDALACAFASEAVLARDWNSPEEDEAWADLQRATS